MAIRLKQLALRRKLSFKEAVNAVLRRGLGTQDRRAKPEPFRVDTFRSRFRPGVDPQRLNQLADELDAQRFRAR